MHIKYEGSDPQDDYEAQRDAAIAACKAEALAKSITEDDVYELCCSLEMNDDKTYAKRECMAETMRLAQVVGEQHPTQLSAFTALGRLVYDLLNENRAHRAEQKYWEEV